ncbi:MAG TPA: kelch repeat-containing protein [Polyangiaceae bacterium]|nr:kelch repeat-containing protein [Polyangiaceae bacterium]
MKRGFHGALLLGAGLASTPSCQSGPQPSNERIARQSAAVTVTELDLAAPSHPTLTFVTTVVRNTDELWHKYSLVVPDDLRLRLIDDALEFLNDGGVPQLRLNVPLYEVNDTDRGPGYLEVEDCLVDRNPAPPWGRSFQHPITTCSVYVHWKNHAPSFVNRDAFLDTGWELPACISEPRAEPAVLKLQNGRWLAIGGKSARGALTSTELYDPETGTWAATGLMKNGRNEPRAVMLDDGKVLVLGYAQDKQAGELYDPATGAWTDVSPVPEGHDNFGIAALSGNRALLAGGTQPWPYPSGAPITAQVSRILDLSAGPPGVWSLAAKTPWAVWWPPSVSLPDGRVVMIGGGDSGVTGSPTFIRYDPVTDDWDSGPFGMQRIQHTLTLLPDQHIAAVAGSSSKSMSAVHFYDPDDMTTSSGPLLTYFRQDHTTSLLPGGVLVTVGGVSNQGDVRGDLTQIEQLVLGEASWTTSNASLPEPRRDHAAVVLPDRSILIFGGHYYEDRGISYEILPNTCVRLELESGDPGCFSSDDCSGDPCVDGVCCDSPCDGACEACSSYKKGYGVNGVCEPIAAGRDPEWECALEDVSTCGSTGACDGSGACTTYADDTVCQSASCVGTTWTLESKCSGGACVPDGVIECNAGFQCVAGACATFCTDDTACAADHTCDAGSCKPDGTGGTGGSGGSGGSAGTGGGGSAGTNPGGSGGAAGSDAGGAGGASDVGGATAEGGNDSGGGGVGSGVGGAPDDGAAGDAVTGPPAGAAGAGDDGSAGADAGPTARGGATTSPGSGGEPSSGAAPGAGEPARAQAGDDGGCGCRVQRGRGKTSMNLALALVLFGALRRRRGRSS